MAKKKTVNHRKGTLERREMKRKVRASPEWAELRNTVAEEQNNIDPVTLRPLTRGFNLHHLSQNAEHYGDLDPVRFVALNHQTHELIHALYNIYKREKDWEFLDEIKHIISEMIYWTEYDDMQPLNNNEEC